MQILEYVLLGIIQGLTEFLPISSSGHLELAKALLSEELLGDEGLFVTVVLHMATAFSTIVVFRKDIMVLIKGLFGKEKRSFFSYFIKIAISMIPAVLVGLIFENKIETFFQSNILLVGFMLLFTGILLYLADKAKTTPDDVLFTHSLLIGIAQAIAILPGISRSGATIATSVLLGIDRAKAAKFSFLMVIPLIFGKSIKDLLEKDYCAESINVIPILFGFVTAFFVGILACNWMIKLVKKSKLVHFSFYCFVVGGLAILVALYKNILSL